MNKKVGKMTLSMALAAALAFAPAQAFAAPATDISGHWTEKSDYTMAGKRIDFRL